MENSNQNNTNNIESTLNFIYFCSNYSHDFIDKAFNSDLANHLKSKFTGDITKFMRELSFDNQVILLKWIEENYSYKGFKAKIMEYNILSPDGFTISIDNFKTPEEADNYALEWKEKFKKQGYYSSNRGKIHFDEILNYCRPISCDIEED